MARSAALSPAARLRLYLRAYRWRRVGVLAATSLVVSLTLIVYLFGWADHFISRLFTSFFIGFSLLAVTFLGILPFIGWATTHWFGAGWATEVDAPAQRRASAAKRPAPRSLTF